MSFDRHQKSFLGVLKHALLRLEVMLFEFG